MAIRLGITGPEGFLGTVLRCSLRGDSRFTAVCCPREAFQNPGQMDDFLSRCDAVVHFAGLSRHSDGAFLLETNLALTRALIQSLERIQRTPHLFFASTTHEAKQLPYHESKRRCRKDLEDWADRSGGQATTLLMPNAFGPYGKPFFNSVVPTFCLLAAQGKIPERIDDVELKLISADTLCRTIRQAIAENFPARILEIPHEYTIRLPELWRILTEWSRLSPEDTPMIRTRFEADLWPVFRTFAVNRKTPGG